ncbi:hypothetical protein CTEN210_04180 [Chaetoceros tenuissimus]|uniref:G-protein coupled receptors family 2 profile 2 domain-containing protein n=1 Tax=Chaetoceros tenuissimus TaxID=426638 RepID=A0AAD3H292_9STRA|nr:hypothetical protein CTEN210_04180 [Chaetoceros tenuissimus]
MLRHRPISNENRKEFSIPSAQRSMKNEELENARSSAELVHIAHTEARTSSRMRILQSNIAEGDTTGTNFTKEVSEPNVPPSPPMPPPLEPVTVEIPLPPSLNETIVVLPPPIIYYEPPPEQPKSEPYISGPIVNTPPIPEEFVPPLPAQNFTAETGTLFPAYKAPKTYLTRNNTRTLASVQMTSSIISLIATITLITMIARSHAKLTSVFHRLLLGLCIADLISSFTLSLSTAPIPSEASSYIWNASGSIATCTAQGFFAFVGLTAAPFYNCSLCFYYLFVITKNKKDEYIRKKVEPWLHALPIVISLTGAIIIASKEAFNIGTSFCWVGSDPPGCFDDPGVECTRGNDAKTLYLIFATGPYIALPIVIVLTMALMYRTAKENEKKMSGYGIHTLRLRATIANGDQRQETDESSTSSSERRRFSSIRQSFQKFRSSLHFCRKDDSIALTTRSNKLNKQSKAVIQKAWAYSLAFFATYFFPLLLSIFDFTGRDDNLTLNLLARIFYPLQGLFNFMVFIYPRIISARQRDKSLTFGRAFIHAIQSRGQLPRGAGKIVSRRRMEKKSPPTNLSKSFPVRVEDGGMERV